jgi:hypothetical protein
MKKINKIFAEISAGELIDKITILEIKQEKIKDASKLQSIKTELTSLQQTLNEHITIDVEIKKLSDELKKINFKLWDIEDGKRNCEKEKNFGEKFIELARNVYLFNDQRAKIKLQINNHLGSNIKEVKSYD